MELPLTTAADDSFRLVHVDPQVYIHLIVIDMRCQMENKELPKTCGTSIRSSRFDQSIKSVEKLKAQLARARARVQQETKLAEKRKRYAERHREDLERQMLGRMCQTIGLGNFRLEPMGEAAIGSIDAEFVAGAIALLVEQLRELDSEQRLKLKESGAAYIQRYIIERGEEARKE